MKTNTENQAPAQGDKQWAFGWTEQQHREFAQKHAVEEGCITAGNPDLMHPNHNPLTTLPPCDHDECGPTGCKLEIPASGMTGKLNIDVPALKKELEARGREDRELADEMALGQKLLAHLKRARGASAGMRLDAYEAIQDAIQLIEHRPAAEGETPRTGYAALLRAMVRNYGDKHQWDVLDSKACEEAAKLIDTLERENAALRGLLRELADANNVDDPCDYDGDVCRTHWNYGRPCLAERVRAALGKHGNQ